MSANGIPDWAGEYVGIPYKTHGRDKDGCDCWGLLCMIWHEKLNQPMPEYEGADWFKGQKPEVVGIDAVAYASQFEPIVVGEEKLGDGMLLRLRGHPFHVGMVLAPGWMIHTHEAADSVIEPYNTFAWRNRINGIYRYKAQ